MRLYRAVSQAELNDIVTSGAFRLDPDKFVSGKWFALDENNASEWGRRFASWDGSTYRIVETEIDDAVYQQSHREESLDNIGAAVFVEEADLPSLTVVTHEAYLLDENGSIVLVQLASKALPGE